MKKKVFCHRWGRVRGKPFNRKLNEDYNVTIYDTLYFGKDHLNHLSDKINIIQGDIRDTELLNKSCSAHNIFIHLACI